MRRIPIMHQIKHNHLLLELDDAGVDLLGLFLRFLRHILAACPGLLQFLQPMRGQYFPSWPIRALVT